MATLVLSSVGTALGGPVGAAIGALIGQSFDRQLLGGGRGEPRIGDLSVQTSSYGTQIPRVYGTMRVAGSVIWSTDLMQSVETAGAKGQPDTAFSYAISFAVAVSSRPIQGIGRIWADGKLIRESDGTFRVPVTFRVHTGGEDQELDPLIGSTEGIGTTPAYRGLAMAVFEDLELVEFGNRLPFLTFEVLADNAPTTIAHILEDVSEGLVQTTHDQEVVGFAAYGASAATAIAPLIEAFGVRLFDDGVRLRAPTNVGPEMIPASSLGSGAGEEPAPKVQVEQSSSKTLPTSLRLAHYDPAKDFQSSEARASVSDRPGVEQRIELPAVVRGETAKAIADDLLARRWAEREKLILRLPPDYMRLEPGSLIALESEPHRIWEVSRCSLERFVISAELALRRGEMELPAVPEPIELPLSRANADEITLAMFEVPMPDDPGQTQPILLLAASSPGRQWRPQSALLHIGCHESRVATASRKSVLGHSTTAVPASACFPANPDAGFEIQLIDHEQWLTSCDDSAMACGVNLAILGKELLQFGDAESLGKGRFRLSRLLRGVAGSPVSDHSEGEPFVLAQPDSLRTIPIPTWSKAKRATVRLRTRTGGETSASAIISRPYARTADAGDFQVLRRMQPPIIPPSGGGTVDLEARAALNAALEALRRHGLIES